MLQNTRYLLQILLIASLLILSLTGKAQLPDTTMPQLNFTLGLKPSYGDGTVGIAPLSASMDFYIPNVVAGPGQFRVGWLLAASTDSREYKGGSIKSSHYIVAERTTYYFSAIPSVETYGGLLFGIRAVRTEERNFPDAGGRLPLRSRPLFAGFIGAKYYFLDQLGVMAELGYGYTVLNLGISLKLNN